jgi:hypothetical protein
LVSIIENDKKSHSNEAGFRLAAMAMIYRRHPKCSIQILLKYFTAFKIIVMDDIRSDMERYGYKDSTGLSWLPAGNTARNHRAYTQHIAEKLKVTSEEPLRRIMRSVV